MKITDGINWVITCTDNFEQTVAFFRDVMGLAITAEGVPVTDTQFTRYAQITLPTSGVLEIVEPAMEVRQLYTAPIVSFTVDDIGQARRELEEQQVVFVAPIFRTNDGWGWTYFRAPDGNVYQLQGRYAE
jgi:predicted enzyme related to lactoylglutathione lyase